MECMDLWAIVPELILAGFALCLVPVAGLSKGRGQNVVVFLAVCGLVAAAVFSVRMLPWQDQAVFCGTYAVDGFGTVFKLLILLGALLSLFAIGSHIFAVPAKKGTRPPRYSFRRWAECWQQASLDLGLIVLFLQLLSMASYILVALVRTDREANEAALKYFIYGAVALWQ